MSLNFDKKFDSFEQYLKETAPVLQKYLLQNLDNVISTFEADKHKDVDKYLYDPLRAWTKNIGKLARPLTFLATYLAANCGDDSQIEDVLPIACAIENFQTAALIHDDIADGGQLRRGKPCMYLEEGEGIAINAGDFGLASTVGGVVEALRQSKFSKTEILYIVRQLIFMEYMTIEGQAMDLGWARDGRFDISEDDYICMATKKSAYYSVAIPCVLGAYCADAPEELCLALKSFGEKLGVAFQIQDDLLNLIANENSENVKDFRNDITEAKRTLVVVKALELSKESDKLTQILKKNTSDEAELEEAVQIMIECGAIDYAKDKAKNLSEKAKNILEDALPSSQ